MKHQNLFLIFTRVMAVLVIAAALVFSGNANLASANPPSGHGSTFEDADGNLAVDTTGNNDWNAPIIPIACPAAAPGAGTNCGLDLVKNGSDDSLGQGSKEDDEAPTIVSGQIPPSKDDLSRLYFNLQTVGTGSNQKLFLFLAWERSNLLGSAHMDFELNQDRTPSANGLTPVRTPGDLLIAFDFGGSGVPVLSLHSWITGTNGETPADCEANNTLPCWKKGVDLTGTEAEAAVNSAPVTDTNQPGAPFTLAGNTKNGINSTFGEAGIDLTEANIFSSSVCEHFGAAWLKSRSSGNSFTSELKDFIAPIPIDISNCGNIIIRKITDPSPDPTTTTFAYSTTGGLTPSSFNLKDGENQDYGNKVFAGSYTVTEGDPGTSFVLSKLDCSASSLTNGSSASTDLVSGTVNISLKAGDVVDCTYTNKLQQGALKISKTSVKGTVLAGAKFSVSGPSGSYTLTTDSSGAACVDKLQFGDYSVTETAAPSGYSIDDATTHTVPVSANSSCGDGKEASFSATDTPLTDLVITATSEVSGGTKSSIKCVSSDNTDIGNSPVGIPTMVDPAKVTANGLKPGTYTCTVVVDP
jgi:hypothetical protein